MLPLVLQSLRHRLRLFGARHKRAVVLFTHQSHDEVGFGEDLVKFHILAAHLLRRLNGVELVIVDRFFDVESLTASENASRDFPHSDETCRCEMSFSSSGGNYHKTDHRIIREKIPKNKSHARALRMKISEFSIVDERLAPPTVRSFYAALIADAVSVDKLGWSRF